MVEFQGYLQFYNRESKGLSQTWDYVSLRKTNYSGKKFRAFMERELGAKALIKTDERNKIIILNIIIPKNKKNLIVYK